MRDGAGESDPLAIRSVPIRVDRAVVAGDFLRLTARGGNGVEHIDGNVVVRLVNGRGCVEEARAVRTPRDIALAEIGRRQLLGLGLFVFDVDGPDVRAAREITV